MGGGARWGNFPGVANFMVFDGAIKGSTF